MALVCKQLAIAAIDNLIVAFPDTILPDTADLPANAVAVWEVGSV